MSPAGHAHGGGGLTLAALALVGALALGYLALAGARRREARGWSPWRTGSFLVGCALLVLGLEPRLSPFPPGSFTSHMHQHLLVGMYAPIGLVLGAPVTLLLRSVPARAGRLVGRALRSRPSHLVANPVTALVLNIGGLAALYLTPLYDAMTSSTLLHHIVHAHFLAAGYLFAWVVAGPDPAPRRPGVPARLVVLGVAIIGHAVLSQLLYAGALVQVSAAGDDRRSGAELMYYGGDIAELALAVALVTTWRPRRAAAAGPIRYPPPERVRLSTSHAPHSPPRAPSRAPSREPWSETVSAVCDVCGKKPSFGHNVPNSQHKTNRRWSPNIQRVRTMVNGVTPRRINACTSCLKAGKVLKPTL